MGHKALEQEPGRISMPATEQKHNELSLARELRGVIDEILGKKNSVRFNFEGRKFYTIDPNTCGVSLIENGEFVFGSVEASLLTSEKWPTPEWTPKTAEISKDAERRTVEVRGQKDFTGIFNYGVELIIEGTYPRINNIVPKDSLEVAKEEMRQSHGKFHPPDPVYKYPGGTVEIPARDARLRSRKDRLEYGKFLLNRIKAAASGEKLLL